MKPSFRADPQPYKVNLDKSRYSDASSIVKNLLMVLLENERAPVTVNNIPSHTNRGSLTTPPSPHDAPAWPPAWCSDCTLSGCSPALTSSRQAFRVPSRRAHPVSGLSPASAPSPPASSTPHPCAVKSGATHRVEEGGGGMAIHGLQGILNGLRQPKPRNEYAVPQYRVTAWSASTACVIWAIETSAV
jgi:hypothetical protein